MPLYGQRRHADAWPALSILFLPVFTPTPGTIRWAGWRRASLAPRPDASAASSARSIPLLIDELCPCVQGSEYYTRHDLTPFDPAQPISQLVDAPVLILDSLALKQAFLYNQQPSKNRLSNGINEAAALDISFPGTGEATSTFLPVSCTFLIA